MPDDLTDDDNVLVQLVKHQPTFKKEGDAIEAFCAEDGEPYPCTWFRETDARMKSPDNNGEELFRAMSEIIPGFAAGPLRGDDA